MCLLKLKYNQLVLYSEEKWTDKSSFIKLTIIAKHSLSGLNKVYSKEFYSVDCITEKQFVSGDSLKVV